MNPQRKLAPFWLLLFGVAGLGAGIEGLLSDAIAIPSTIGLSGRLARDAQPAAYWALTAAYLVAGAFFLQLGWRRRAQPEQAEPEPEPPRPASPGWARGLAWAGTVFGALLIAAAVMFHFTLDVIVSLPFVAVFGGGGLLIGLTSVGYLVTGRL